MTPEEEAREKARETAVLERLCGICMAFPEVEERASHGERLGFWCPAAEGVQEMRVEQDPDTFYRPPYVGVRGWLGVNLDGDPGWEDVEDIVREAYLKVAPRTLAAQTLAAQALAARLV